LLPLCDLTNTHLSVGQHLHILLRFVKKYSSRNRREFDYVCNKHGDYRTCRSQYGAHNYLSKEDPSPLSFGAILKPGSEAAKAQTKNKRQRAEDGSLPQSKASKYATDMLSGASARSILRQDPGYYLQNKRKIEEYAAMCRVYASQLDKQEWPGPLDYQGTHSQTREIIDWLNSNIKTNRYFRQEQLYISGPKQHYKTTMVRLLRVFLMIYDMPKSEDFYDLYEDDLYDLVLLDEFKGQKKPQDLNEWLQGEDINVRQKGKQSYKKDNLPMIILANWPIYTVYKNLTLEHLEPTMSRLKMIDLESPIDIKGFADALHLIDHPIMKATIVHSGTINDSVSDDRSESLLSTSTDGILPSTTRVIQITSQHNSGSRTTTPSTSLLAEKFKKHRRAPPKFCQSCGQTQDNCRCKFPDDSFINE